MDGVEVQRGRGGTPQADTLQFDVSHLEQKNEDWLTEADRINLLVAGDQLLADALASLLIDAATYPNPCAQARLGHHHGRSGFVFAHCQRPHCTLPRLMVGCPGA